MVFVMGIAFTISVGGTISFSGRNGTKGLCELAGPGHLPEVFDTNASRRPVSRAIVLHARDAVRSGGRDDC